MIGTTVSTHASVAGVALVIGLLAGGCLVLWESQVRVRRSRTSSDPPPSRSDDPSYGGQLRRIWYTDTYGAWIKYVRILLISVTVGALLVAAVAAALVALPL